LIAVFKESIDACLSSAGVCGWQLIKIAIIIVKMNKIAICAKVRKESGLKNLPL